MPITKSAIKNVRKTKRNTVRNKRFISKMKRAVKEFFETTDKSKAKELEPKVVSLVDRAAKKNLIHDNKAARLKSKMSKFDSAPAAKEDKPAKKPAAAKKAPAKKAPAKKAPAAKKPEAKKEEEKK